MYRSQIHTSTLPTDGDEVQQLAPAAVAAAPISAKSRRMAKRDAPGTHIGMYIGLVRWVFGRLGGTPADQRRSALHLYNYY